MKSNKEYYSLLTIEEQALFEGNFALNSKLSNEISFDEWLDRSSNSFTQFLSSGFFWDGTEQGHEYWASINADNRYLPEWTKMYYNDIDMVGAEDYYVIRSGCKFINLPKRLAETIAEEMLLLGLVNSFVIPELNTEKKIIFEKENV